MTIRVAINGYGRIGRNTLRAFYENGKKHDIEIVAINDLGDANTNAHLTQYDTAHGKFPGEVSVDGDYLVVNGDRIRVLANRNPAELPWGELNVDVVMECTGFFTTKEKASAHIKGGAKKVIISAPGGKDVDATIVYGVNHKTLKASHTVISNASCTTNCLAPLVKPLHDAIGVVNGLMTTVHAYTNDQVLVDVFHEDLRRARSAQVLVEHVHQHLVVGVGVHRRHEAIHHADGVVQRLYQRREAIGRARRVRDHGVRGLERVVVDPEHHGGVDVLAAGRRDDHLLRAALQVRGGLLLRGEESGAFEDHVDAE